MTPEEIARDLLREYRWQVPDHSDVMADQIVAAVRPVIYREAAKRLNHIAHPSAYAYLTELADDMEAGR